MKFKYLLAACTAFFLYLAVMMMNCPNRPNTVISKMQSISIQVELIPVLLLPNIDRLRKTVETWNYHGLTIRVIQSK